MYNFTAIEKTLCSTFGLSKEQLDNIVNAKRKKLRMIITLEASLLLVAKDYGIIIQEFLLPDSKPKRLKQMVNERIFSENTNCLFNTSINVSVNTKEQYKNPSIVIFSKDGSKVFERKDGSTGNITVANMSIKDLKRVYKHIGEAIAKCEG